MWVFFSYKLKGLTALFSRLVLPFQPGQLPLTVWLMVAACCFSSCSTTSAWRWVAAVCWGRSFVCWRCGAPCGSTSSAWPARTRGETCSSSSSVHLLSSAKPDVSPGMSPECTWSSAASKPSWSSRWRSPSAWRAPSTTWRWKASKASSEKPRTYDRNINGVLFFCSWFTRSGIKKYSGMQLLLSSAGSSRSRTWWRPSLHPGTCWQRSAERSTKRCSAEETAARPLLAVICSICDEFYNRTNMLIRSWSK